MKHHFGNFVIGDIIANQWGVSSTTSEEAIKGLTTDRQQLAVMCAMLTAIQRLTRRVDCIMNENPPPTDDPSDGMLTAIMHMRGDKLIANSDKSHLSVRARKAISRTGVKFWSEVTHERLSMLRNCGDKTIQEILKFKSSQYGASHQ